MRVLVIEDEPKVAAGLCEGLQSEGYDVVAESTGEGGFYRATTEPFDLVLLDLGLPARDGLEILRALRERGLRTPVLILTAKHVTKEELSVLKGNHISQLIQKGDINKRELLAAVALMVAPRPEQPAPPSPRRRRPARPGQPVVLVVEDNPDSLRTARALLEDCYRVIDAQDGRAGVELARTHQPDIILMDISLPVMDGVQALQEIRKDETLRHIPVIAVTASAMMGDQETIMAHGFDSYLSKPIDHDALKKTIRDFLD